MCQQHGIKHKAAIKRSKYYVHKVINSCCIQAVYAQFIPFCGLLTPGFSSLLQTNHHHESWSTLQLSLAIPFRKSLYLQAYYIIKSTKESPSNYAIKLSNLASPAYQPCQERTTLKIVNYLLTYRPGAGKIYFVTKDTQGLMI